MIGIFGFGECAKQKIIASIGLFCVSLYLFHSVEYMSPVFPGSYTVTTVSWSQKRVKNDNIHSTILDVHVFKVLTLTQCPFVSHTHF